MPRVSIVIPAFNRELYITDCLSSALNQTFSDIEVIIVDNCSTDNTLNICQQIARKDSRVKIYKNDKNIGPVRNWIKAIDLATADIVKILWSDDMISETFIEKTYPILLENSDVGFVLTAAIVFDEDNKTKELAYVIGKPGFHSMQTYVEGVLLGNNWPYSPGCAIFRKTDLKKNLLLNIPNKIGSDFSMHAVGNDLTIFLLTSLDYEKFYFIDEPLSQFRSHSDSISTSSKYEKLILLYHMAKAFFIENYVRDAKLIKKFNSLLALNINRFPNNEIGIRCIKDFYFNPVNVEINKSYYYISMIKKLYLPAILKKMKVV
ncbi:glycosyltransferase family 2 protein [Geotalea sp. SG265]|uniref:glycosyltransferase family 2 protein n=1 Tax=Geotalea sp. SG265 TaxID=2922867 RepID=UPI001FAFE059|nr:glycosyltransferase family 2 protein [Geotalea sp. SG265]